MARILIVVLLLMVILALANVMARSLNLARQSTEGANMPDTVKTISYILLLALMFGVVTGWFGGL